MDSRTAAHALTRIAALLELRGENRFKSRAYEQAARAVRALDSDDLGPAFRRGELEHEPGLGPATLAVLRDLVTDGESALLEELQADTPAGLLALLRIPYLGAAKIHAIHAALGVSTLDELEAAARDGRLATVKGFGPKTVEKVLQGIDFLRRTDAYSLYPRAAAEAARIVENVLRHPDVERAEAAGSVRRRVEVVRDVDVVAACRGDAERTARSFALAPGVREVAERDGTLAVRFVDGTLLDLTCVAARDYALALWRATGSVEHVREVEAHAAARGLSLGAHRLLDAAGVPVSLDDERALYAAVGLAYVPPELREGRGEVAAAARGALPTLVTLGDVRGVLHCHSDYSDGGATIREMADAAAVRGWSYLGITDHSESAFYAGGMKRADVLRQHDEIDRLNDEYAAAGAAFRLLKGIEADILPDGRVDYDDALLARFDYVIGSVHSRFNMSEAEMTERVCRALESPFLTILGHPTGRLLLQREPFAINMHAVLDRAAETGACVELNADPHRLDLDWRLCHRAKTLGVPIEIGPDAHSPGGLDNVAFGVGVARKGWLDASDVLNARSADEVLAFAHAKRER